MARQIKGTLWCPEGYEPVVRGNVHRGDYTLQVRDMCKPFHTMSWKLTKCWGTPVSWCYGVIRPKDGYDGIRET